MSDYIVSLIRTYVPIVVGMAITWLAKTPILDWASIDAGTARDRATFLLVGVVTGAYYAGARWLEKQDPRWGILLGKAKAPTYVPPAPPQG